MSGCKLAGVGRVQRTKDAERWCVQRADLNAAEAPRSDMHASLEPLR